MKTKILLVALFGFTSFLLHAQIENGKVQIGGAFNFVHQKLGADAYTSTNINVSPSIGTFYKTNRLVGAFLSYGYNEYPVAVNSAFVKEIMRTYGVGIFFRQYKPVAQRLYLFFDESGGFTYLNETNSLPPSNLYTVSVSVQPGLAYDITRNLQLEMSLNNLLNVYYSGGQGTSTFGLSSSLRGNLLNSTGLGFRFYLK